MGATKIFESEYRFCLLVWEHEPIGSGELVRLAGEKLGWKPTTAYTVIKRLSERGVLQNEKSVVTSRVSREEVQSSDIDELVDKRFGGSLPAFVAAFAHSGRITEDDIQALEKLIRDYRKEHGI